MILNKDDQIEVFNVDTPGKSNFVQRDKYEEVRSILLNNLPTKLPGVSENEMMILVESQASDKLFPKKETLGWWVKIVQMDLEAKGLLLRTKSQPTCWSIIDNQEEKRLVIDITKDNKPDPTNNVENFNRDRILKGILQNEEELGSACQINYPNEKQTEKNLFDFKNILIDLQKESCEIKVSDILKSEEDKATEDGIKNKKNKAGQDLLDNKAKDAFNVGMNIFIDAIDDLIKKNELKNKWLNEFKEKNKEAAEEMAETEKQLSEYYGKIPRENKIKIPTFYRSDNYDSDEWNKVLEEKKCIFFYSDDDDYYEYGIVTKEQNGFCWEFYQREHFEIHELGRFDLFCLHYLYEQRNKKLPINTGYQDIDSSWLDKSRLQKLCSCFELINNGAKVYFVGDNKKVHFKEWDINMAAPTSHGQVRMEYIIDQEDNTTRYSCIKFNQLLKFVYSYTDWGLKNRYLLGNEYFLRENPFIP